MIEAQQVKMKHRFSSWDPSCCTHELLHVSGQALMDRGNAGMWTHTHMPKLTHTHTHVYAGIIQCAAGLRRDEDRHSYSTEKCDLQTLPFARKRKTGQNNRDRLRRFTHTLKDQHRHWHTNISTPLHFFLEFLHVFLFCRSWFSKK